MRFIFLFIVLVGIGISTSHAASDVVACTADYTPVCGQPPMPECLAGMSCIQVMPPRQTYSNTCMASAAKATDITVGECKSTPIVGGDTDEHGCKASAGYSWNASKNTCTRSWEDTPTVGGDSDEHGCKASAGYSWDATLSQCIRVWEKPQTLVTWAHDNALTRYADVSDFAYERSLTRQEAAAIIARAGEKVWGRRSASYPDNCNVAYFDESAFDLTLKYDIYSACAFDLMHGQGGVFAPNRTLSRAEALASIMRGVDGGKKDESGAMWYENYADRAHELGILSFANFKGFDHPITRGELIEWIYRASQYVTTHREITGTWTLDSYRLDDMMFAGTGILTFENGRYSVKFCNTTSSDYAVSAGVFTAKIEARTRMACLDGHIMTIEDGWTLDGAKYTLDNGVLTITMARGGVYTFSQEAPQTEVLMGDWKLHEFNTTKITDTSRYTLNFDGKSITANFCNNVFGSYTVKNGKFVAPTLASTMMYCEGLPMTLENAFALDGASYSVVALRLAEGATGPTMLLTITTAKGDVYVYGQ